MILKKQNKKTQTITHLKQITGLKSIHHQLNGETPITHEQIQILKPYIILKINKEEAHKVKVLKYKQKMKLIYEKTGILPHKLKSYLTGKRYMPIELLWNIEEKGFKVDYIPIENKYVINWKWR